MEFRYYSFWPFVELTTHTSSFNSGNPEENVIVGLLDGTLHGVSAADGEIVWSSQLSRNSLLSSSPNVIVPSLEGGVFIYEDVSEIFSCRFNDVPSRAWACLAFHSVQSSLLPPRLWFWMEPIISVGKTRR